MAMLRFFMRNVITKRLNSSSKFNLLSENVRFLNSSTPVSSVTASIGKVKTETPAKKQNTPSSGPGRKDQLDVSFNDPVAAFKSKTTLELIRAYFVYVLCSSEKLVEHNMKVNFPAKLYLSPPPLNIHEKTEKSIIYFDFPRTLIPFSFIC